MNFAAGIRALIPSPPQPAPVRARSRPRAQRGSVRRILQDLADSGGYVRGYKIAQIAQMAGTTRNGARKSISYMRQVGDIEVVRASGGQKVANVYRIVPRGTRA